MAAKVTYKLEIRFVDDSYWDDGSRMTRCNKYFSSLDQVNTFVEKHASEPFKVPGQGGGPVNVCTTPENISVYRTEEVDVLTLPCLKAYTNKYIVDQLVLCARFGGNTNEIEERAKLTLEWTRERFLKEWRGVVTRVGQEGAVY